MNFFPAFIDLYEKNVVICGGNEEALKKAEKIMEFGGRVHLFSEDIPNEIKDITVHNKAFSKDDFSLNPVFVIASDTEEENKRISELCREVRILCNAVDQPEDCDFYFPSYYATKNLCVAVSTGGKSPTAAIKIKNEIKDILPSSIDEILDSAVELREEIKGQLSDGKKVKKMLKKIIEKEIDEERVLTRQEISDIICGG